MKKEEAIEMVKKLTEIEDIEEDEDKIMFKLSDDLTRSDVESIVSYINSFLSNYGVLASPFGVNFRRGFHIKKKYLY
jgi:L-asparaginase/Glu-tRNA(Gln) amidotransferase subunit D